MGLEEEEEVLEEVQELEQQLEEERAPQQTLSLLNSSLNRLLTWAAVQTGGAALTRVKSQLFDRGVLARCVHTLALPPRSLRGHWGAAATLAELTSSCCVGVEPGRRLEAFHKLFLPSAVDGLLSLADQLMRGRECASVVRRVMASLGWLLAAYPALCSQVLSSAHYERIQMSDEAAVTVMCIQMWVQSCSSNRTFLATLSDDSVLLLLNEAVGQLAVSSDAAVGGASVGLILLMAEQLEPRLRPLLLSFRGLDSLLDKDWRGRGFDDDVTRVIAVIQSEKRPAAGAEVTSGERARAACVIQAAWRACRTRRRVRSLNRAVSSLQRSFRARRRRQQEQEEARRWEEELRYQVCVRRQQARRRFHQRQRELLQRLPADQVQPYLQECERRAAVVIQSSWRGCRERRRYDDARRHTLTLAKTQEQAACTLQRAVRRFLQRRRAVKAPPLPPLWLGQAGLTDSRRAELRRWVEEHVARQPSSRVCVEECQRLHEEVQLLLLKQLQKGEEQQKEAQRREALLAITHTQLEKLRDAPPLCAVTLTEAESFLSASGPVAARARDAHNAALQASRVPWWRTLGHAHAVGGAPGPALLRELEAEFGGLYVGGGGGF